MSKAGKTVLLTVLLLVLSGGKTYAQGKVLAVNTLGNAKSVPCTTLQEYLVVKANSCENIKLSQRDLVLKAAVGSEEDVESTSISYSFESAYYAPPTPTPTVEIAPFEAPTQTPANIQEPRDMVPADSANLDSDTILNLINAHRASIGKAAFQKEEALCSLAKVRSAELQGELFEGKGYLHSGLYNRNLPYWITENAKWGSNEAGTVRWWLNSPIHRRAIEGDYIYSCGACQGSKCSQLFTSYTPKNGISSNTTPAPLAISH